MKRIIYILFLLILCVLNSDLFAQEWSTGKIVTNQNDTLSGLIAVGEYEELHSHCYYKSGANVDKKIIDIRDLKQLIFDKGQVFETKKIKTNKRNETYLVEKLLTGIINLYSLTTIDSIASRKSDSKELQLDNKYINTVIYVAEITSQNNRLVELINPNISSSYINVKKRNIKILEAIFDQHPEMMNQISKTTYSRNDLILLFKKYHDLVCNDYACITYIQKKEKLKIQVTPYFCFEQNELRNLSNLLINTHEPEWTKYYKYQPAFQIVTSLDFIPFSKKMQINIGVKFAKTNFTKELYMSEIFETYQYKTNSVQIMPTFSVSGTLFKLKIKPIFEFGTYLSFLVGQNNAQYKLIGNNYVFQRNFSYKSPLWGLYAGVGKDFQIDKNHSIPVRIQYSGAPFHRFPRIGVNTFAYSFFSLKIGYSFSL